jgi:hypothetical protein
MYRAGSEFHSLSVLVGDRRTILLPLENEPVFTEDLNPNAVII